MKKRVISIIISICLLAGNIEFLNSIFSDDVFAAGDFSFDMDTWSFSSDVLSDGSEPYLTVELRKKLLSGRSEDEKKRLESRLGAVCSDYSYGLSVLAFLHYNGTWNASDISHGADSLRDIPAPVRKDVFTGFISYYNLLQYTDDIISLDEKALAEDNSAALLNAEKAVSDGGAAVMRLYKDSSSDAYTVLLCGSEKGSWNYEGTRYDSRILIADPANDSFSQGSCLYYTSDGKWIIPDMSMSFQSGGKLGAVIDDVSVLGKNGADSLKLPKISAESVFVYPGDTVIPITVYESCVPECYGMSIDVELSDAASEILHLSFEEGSYDLGGAIPVNLSSYIVNEPDLIVSFFINSVTNGIICEDDLPVITFGMDCADEKTVRVAAEKYNLPLLHDDIYGEYYAFPFGFNTALNSNYYSAMTEDTEYPVLMTGEVCVVVEPAETTSVTTSATTTKVTTSSSTASTTSTTTVRTTSAVSYTTSSTETTTSETYSTTSTSASSAESLTTTTTTTATQSKTTSSSVTTKTTSSESSTTSKTTASSVTTTTTSSKTTAFSVTSTTSSKTTTFSVTSITSSSSATTLKTTASTSSSSLSTTTHSVETTVSTTKLEFKWGTDNWNYPHDLLVAEYITDGYRLLDSHLGNLTASMDPMEKERLQKVLNSDWMGAEYGMAVTEILAKNGVFSVPVWDPSVNSMYELDLMNERNLSIISYYQLLQERNAVQQEIAWTSTSMSPKAVLSQLISMASESSKGGSMTLACFFSSGYSHSAIAYGVEYGTWNIGGGSYDGRVLLSDPYLDSFSDEHCLYFNSATLSWTIPALDMKSSDKGTFIGLASNSVSLINDGGYFIGTSSDNIKHAFVPIIEVPALAEGFTVSASDMADESVVHSNDLKWFSTVASNILYRRAGLQCDTEEFCILPAGSGEADYQLSFEKCMLSVKASNALGVTMNEKGTVYLEAYDSDFEIGITSKSELPWNSVKVSGKNANEVTAEHIGSGIILTGDCLQNLTIKSDSAVRTINEKNIQYKKMLIYAENDGSIGILADVDGDGECETVISDSSENIRYGDVNVDDKISVLDVVYIGKYNARIISLNTNQMKNADCVADGAINSSDLKTLIDYIIAKIDKLPVIVE